MCERMMTMTAGMRSTKEVLLLMMMMVSTKKQLISMASKPKLMAPARVPMVEKEEEAMLRTRKMVISAAMMVLE